jgi:hypothetical protein
MYAACAASSASFRPCKSGLSDKALAPAAARGQGLQLVAECCQRSWS